MSTVKRKFLVLLARNYGDAVIGTAIVESLRLGFPEAQIDVFARPETSIIFDGNPNIRFMHIGYFPMGYVHSFGPMKIWKMILMILRLRREKYTDVINLTGDFREEIISYLVSIGNSWSPAWAEGHPCSTVIRRSAFKAANRPVRIPVDLPSIYSAADLIAMALGVETCAKSSIYNRNQELISWRPGGQAVGIHPLASKAWKKWGEEQWVLLSKQLMEAGMTLHIFGSPSDKDELQRIFGQYVQERLSIQVNEIPEFINNVSRMNLLICGDSFAAHVAYAVGVPILFLNGSNDYRAWAPPGATVFAGGPGMACYPCNSCPTCIGTKYQFDCIRSIPVEHVLAAALQAMGEPSETRLTKKSAKTRVATNALQFWPK